MPALEDIDFLRLIQRWRDDGHMYANSKRRKGEQGKVLARLAKKNAHRSRTPIGTKPGDWKERVGVVVIALYSRARGQMLATGPGT